MDLSFKAIAFELKYSSYQIDSVYAALDLFDRGDQKISVHTLQCFNGHLPKDLKNYLLKFEDTSEKPINILFEQHNIPTNKQHNDWDLISYD